MTDTAGDEVKPDMSSQESRLDKAERHGEAAASEASARVESPDQPVYVGHWILRFLLGASVCALYEQQVTMFNRDLTAYFDISKHISERDRQHVRERFLSSLRLMNAYQAWESVFERYQDAIISMVILPAWLVSGMVAPVLAWTSTPNTIKVVYLLLSLLFLLRAFAVFLRSSDPQFFLPCGKLFYVVAVVSGWLLFGAWSKLGIPVSGGILLLSVTGTMILTFTFLVLILIVPDNNSTMPFAVYLIGIGVLAFGARSHHPNWPSWLVYGIWSAFWASLSLAVVFGAFFILTYLTQAGLWHRKNSRHADAELVQTLTWLGLRLEDAERPKQERSELGLANPEIALIPDLEYIAGLMERFLPRKLLTQNRLGDSIIADRCRGMAAAVRQLKLRLVLNQSTSSGKIAEWFVPAIVPILLGDWERIAHVSQEEQTTPTRWKHALRLLGSVIAAVAPLAVLLALRYEGIVSDKIVAQALPIAVTWLLVSIIAWIDPRTETRISNVKSVTDTIFGSK